MDEQKETSLSVFSYVRMMTKWHCPLPHAAVINGHLLPTPTPAANPRHDAAVGKWNRDTDGRTDRRMDTIPFQRPCSTYYVGSANNGVISQVTDKIAQ